MSWHIRPARLGDVEALAALHVRAWNAAKPAGFDSLPVEDRRVRWKAWFAESSSLPRRAALVAEDDGDLVGFVTVRPAPSEQLEQDGPGQLDELYIDEEHWGTGLAVRLMNEGLDLLRSWGFAHAMLWVIEEHPRARAFYAKHGWVPDGGRKVAFTADGRDVIEIRYAKVL